MVVYITDGIICFSFLLLCNFRSSFSERLLFLWGKQGDAKSYWSWNCGLTVVSLISFTTHHHLSVVMALTVGWLFWVLQHEDISLPKPRLLCQWSHPWLDQEFLGDLEFSLYCLASGSLLKYSPKHKQFDFYDFHLQESNKWRMISLFQNHWVRWLRPSSWISSYEPSL